MSWSRCSRLVPAVLAVLVLAASAGVVSAVAVSTSNVPDDAAVGSDVSGTFELTELYDDGVDEWTLRATTGLRNASWTVRKHKLNGDVVSVSGSGSTFNTTVSAGNNVERITVTVRGTVPRVENFSYDPPQQFTMVSLVKRSGGNDRFHRQRVHHHTADSQQARQAIDSAAPVVEGSGSDEARQQLRRAIEAYNGGQFALATDLAESAEQTAQRARGSRERTQLLLFGGIGLVALVAVFGGVYYWRSQQDSYDKLR